MKTNICLTIILIPFLLWSQFKSSIDFVAGVEYSYRVLNNTFEDSLHKSLFQYRNGETRKLNFRIGFNYNRKITEQIWLKSGLRFASIGYNSTKQTGLTWDSEFDPISGIYKRDPNLPHEIYFSYDYWFIEVPIIFRYAVNTKKLCPFFEIGLSPNIYLTTRTKQVTDIDSKTLSQMPFGNFNTLSFSGNISVGLIYHLNDRFALFGQAVFRYHFTPLADGPIQEHLFNVGMELGVRKQFN